MQMILLIISILSLTPDTSCCNVDFVLKQKQENVYLYTDSNGFEIIDTIINDTITENYFLGRIYCIENGYAYIEGNYTLDSIKCEGWIRIEDLGIYTLLSNKIPLYEEPNISSHVSFIINPEWYPLKVIKCDKDWLYIIYEDKWQKLSGWLSRDYQCANPYSTCN